MAFAPCSGWRGPRGRDVWLSRAANLSSRPRAVKRPPSPTPTSNHTHLEGLATRPHTPPPRYPGFEALERGRSATLALIGDTQRTSRLELLRRPHDAEQRALLADLARRRPDGLIHLGDLVTWGSAGRSWRRLDQLLGDLRASGVPLLPVRGNHEYMPLRGGVERHWAPRFPHLAGRRWYSFRWRGLAFVALDSNLRALGERAARTQDRWLADTLDALAGDPSVRGVIGLWHHPPFTNSKIVRPSAAAERRFVGPLLAMGKAIAVFNGHCHAYEHFEHRGVHFIVTGGGGGPLQRVEHRPERQRFPDRFGWRWPIRFLNYGLLHDAPTGLRVDIWRVLHPSSPLELIDRVPLS